MRRSVAVLIAMVVAAMTIPPTSEAAVSFDGPQAVGATLGAGLLAGIVCWTVELAAGEQERDEHDQEEASDDFDRRGWFIGLEGVYGREFLDEGKEEKSLTEDIAVESEFGVTGHDTGGFSLTAGRRCHSRFSVEIEFEWLDKFNGSLTDVSRQKKSEKVSFAPITATLNLKGYLLTGRFQPYVLLGGGLLSIRTDRQPLGNAESQGNSQTSGMLALRVGGGIDIYATRNWVVTAGLDYVFPVTTTLDRLSYLSLGIGLEYRF